MTMQRTPLLIWRLLDRGAWIAPDTEIVTQTSTGTHRQTYADTAERAAALANGLKDLRIELGDRVATFMWNSWRHLEIYQAVPSMGAVLHTLNIRLGAADLRYIINHAADRIIFVDADLAPLLERIAGDLPSVERYVICGEPGAGPWESSLPNAVDYESFLSGYGTSIAWPEFDENAPLGLCYTSGTTGHPKGVMYTHRSTYLHTMCEAMTDVMTLSGTDCTCGIVPMFHAMGWGLPYTATMLGAKQVMPHRFMTPDKLLDLMVSESVTISAGVPTIWQGVRALLEAEPDRYDLSNLTRLCSGGSAPPISLIRWYWDRYRIEMIQGWGMTETNPIGTVSRVASRSTPTERWAKTSSFANLGKAGLLCPGARDRDRGRGLPPPAARRKGDWRAAGPGAVGLLGVLPGPAARQVPRRLAGDRRHRRDRRGAVPHHRGPVEGPGEVGGRVDLVRRPREPHRGPRRRRARRGGGAAAPKMGRTPGGPRRPRARGATVSADEVGRHCAARFAKWQLPDDVLFRDSLPLTSTGKIDKKTVRAGLAAEGYVLPELRTAPGAPGAPDAAGGQPPDLAAVPIPGFLFLHRAASRLRIRRPRCTGADRPRAAGPEPRPARRRRGRW